MSDKAQRLRGQLIRNFDEISAELRHNRPRRFRPQDRRS